MPKNKYYWVIDGNLIMKCILDKEMGEKIFVRTPNGANLSQMYTIGENAFQSKEDAVRRQVFNIRLAIQSLQTKILNLMKVEEYLSCGLLPNDTSTP